MTLIESRVAQLARARIFSSKQEASRRSDKIAKLIEEFEVQLCHEKDKIDTVRLAAELSEFQQLNQFYAQLLEWAAGKSDETNIPTEIIRSIRDALETRRERSNEAIMVFTNLMRDKMAAINQHAGAPTAGASN